MAIRFLPDIDMLLPDIAQAEPSLLCLLEKDPYELHIPDIASLLRSKRVESELSLPFLAPPNCPVQVSRAKALAKQKTDRKGQFLVWWLLPDSNWGHKALQASALPTELKSHISCGLASALRTFAFHAGAKEPHSNYFTHQQ